MEMRLEIPFTKSRLAEVAYHSLRVDPEPPRSDMTKVLKVEQAKLIVEFRAADVKSLRVGVNAFLDLLILVVKTVDRFDPPQN